MSALTLDEMAVDLRRGRGGGASGIRYARIVRRVEKAQARNRVLAAFSGGTRDSRLAILTMPSLGWHFERALIANREHGRGRTYPRRTYITAIEADPRIYAAAMARMPGADSSVTFNVPVPPFAQQACRTLTIGRFFNCTFEDMAEHYATMPAGVGFDGAWVDLCGPLTIRRLDALETLWSRIRSQLVVTSLNARWPTDIGSAVRGAGGIGELLLDVLPDAWPTDEVTYRDGSPMHQIVLRRSAVTS